MGYFDALASSAFKRDAEDQTVFYPTGIFGSGYIVPTTADEQRLCTILVRFYKVLLLVAVPLGAILSPWLFLLPVLGGIGFQFWLKRTTSTWQKSATRTTFRESMAAQARNYNTPTLWALLVGSILLFLGSIFTFQRGSSMDLVTGVVGCLLFGFGIPIFALMIKHRRSQLKSPKKQD